MAKGWIMAWIEQKKRADGGLSARVVWRYGGARDGAYQSETFSAGSDAQNLARAEGFRQMVHAAGQRWPEGWVRGEGFVRPPGEADPLTKPPRFVDIGEGYVRQIVDISPGQRKRYLGHLGVLASLSVRGVAVFVKPVTSVTEADLRAWLIDWDRSLKTKANYHGLIHGVFVYAVKRGYLTTNPAVGTAPKRSRVRQSTPQDTTLPANHHHLACSRSRAQSAGGWQRCRRLRLHQPDRPAHPQRGLLRFGLAAADDGTDGSGHRVVPLPRSSPYPCGVVDRGRGATASHPARLGHESITTTIDTYGHLLPAGDELISGIIDTALSGGIIRPTPSARA
jgi:hypothetical protein